MLEFPTQDRWLTGEEYAFLLRHFRAYRDQFPDKILVGTQEHPDQVYDSPKNGQIYFIQGWHLREFGFPRKDELRKRFKWKKMNFTTDLPKNDPLCSYLVATGRVDDECYRMHVVVNAREYSKQYRQSDVLKQLRTDAKKSKSKLLPEDREFTSERMILCHILIRKNCPHQPVVTGEEALNSFKTKLKKEKKEALVLRKRKVLRVRTRSSGAVKDLNNLTEKDLENLDGFGKKKRGRPKKYSENSGQQIRSRTQKGSKKSQFSKIDPEIETETITESSDDLFEP